ncbi:MAG TPA: AI-2E family transporter [Anaerolineaceae bacterium]|nr:AI-2E family transporter [Anaerolineaceae bacterium]HPN53412.1 AI-2E family transporter [Anaerolineaceae bacterium]
MHEDPSTHSTSPLWGPTTKLVVALTIVAIIAFLFATLRDVVGPVLVSFIIAYLMYPIAAGMRKYLHLHWRVCVAILYLFLVILLLSSLTISGLALFEQLQSLVGFLQKAVVNVPAFLEDLSKRVIIIGPFTIDFVHMDFNAVSKQVLDAVQPLLGQIGTVLGRGAASAATLVSWGVFSLLISYFILAETNGEGGKLLDIQLPGYGDDFRRLGVELGHIWNAFLRGQLFVISVTILLYTAYLSGMGVNYAFGLACVAGLARFIPYIGPAIAWTAYATVCIFQGYTPFGLTPVTHAAVVVVFALLLDYLIDSFIATAIMSGTLKIHPAAMLIAALAGAAILGMVGVLLATPVLATIKLIFEYILNKLLDRDPWEHMALAPRPEPTALQRWLVERWGRFRSWLKNRSAKKTAGRDG